MNHPMKKFLALLVLSFALVTARAADGGNFAITTDTNGVLQHTGTGPITSRNTNLFYTNMTRLVAAVSNSVGGTNYFVDRTTAQTLLNKKLASPEFTGTTIVATEHVTNWTGHGVIRVNTNAAQGIAAGILFDQHWFLYGIAGDRMAIENSDTGEPLIVFEYDGNTMIPSPLVVSNTITSTMGITSSTNVLRENTLSESTVVGLNHLAGRYSSLAGAYSSLINGNNANLPTGTNSIVIFSGGTTIAQIAGFAATSEGDEFEAQFSGAVTNWIVNETGSAFSTDTVAANRIKTGTGGDVPLTNQPSFARFRYTGSRWVLKAMR
jgi:hypothetical protein